VHSIKAQLGFTSRDKDTTVEAHMALWTEHDTLLAQQTYWEDLWHTTKKLEHLSVLGIRTQVNKSELKELHHVHNHSKVLKSKHASLQQWNKEQKTWADEWEQCANEHEVALANAQAALEDAEDCIV
jgi:hypothetical protein